MINKIRFFLRSLEATEKGFMRNTGRFNNEDHLLLTKKGKITAVKITTFQGQKAVKVSYLFN